MCPVNFHARIRSLRICKMDILLRLCLWDVYGVSIGMWCFVAACFAHNGGVLNVAYSEELQDN